MFEKFTDTITHQDQVHQTTLDKLKDIIPSAFKDGEFCLSTFLQELNLENSSSERERERESYGFHWVGKEQARQLANFDLQYKTLKPNYEKSLNFEDSNNIIIEGDNLEVLQILRKSYFNSIDVIYIDPPYNTGNDSFVYNDNFKQTLEEYKESLDEVENSYNWHENSKSSGRFHTNWLNMMYPRLKIAHRLLKDDGVIFISIDDNEQARLKLLCDEIFGEQNFISCIIWQKTTGANDSLFLKETTEYILMYSKNKTNFNVNKINLDVNNDKSFKYEDEYVAKRGKYKLVNLDNASHSYSKSLDYEIVLNNKFYYAGRSKENWLQRQKGVHANKDWQWMWSKNKLEWGIKKGFIVEINNTLKNKVYQYVDNNDMPTIRKQSFKNLILVNEISNLMGTNKQKEIFGRKIFDHPKPNELISFLVNLSINQNALVLDFFAGSGTTGQAVMELNKEDGGNRKYILVQINEQLEDQSEFKVISDITRERIKRSIEKYDYKEKGFKFFEVCPTHFKNLDNKIDLNENQQISFEDYINSIKPNTDLIDLIYEMILNLKLKLDTKLLKDTILGHNVIIDEAKTYLFILDSDNYDNVFDVINSVWQQKNGDGTLTVYLLENKLDDTIKTNLSEKIKCICSTNNIKIEVI